MVTDSARAGRDAFARRAWRQAYEQFIGADQLEIADLELLAVAAHLMGAGDRTERWAHAHQECLRMGEVARAVRCAFWLAYGLIEGGEAGLGAGWLAKAERLIDDAGLDCAERGYLLVPRAIGCFDQDPAAALKQFLAAIQIGERFADVGLATLGRMGQGQALIALGRWAEARRVLDEAMVAVTAEEVAPIVAGNVFCGAIDACQEILDIGRAREWTAALSRWCDPQPDLVPFRGECLVHRAEVMQLRGDWPDAAAEADRACRLLSGKGAGGAAWYRVGELRRLRGELAEAEQAYRAASSAGRDPQPGLALLRLRQGQPKAAAATVRRVLADASNPAARARLLGPFVEIMLAAGDVGAARAGADELSTLASAVDTPFLRAVAAGCSGSVLLAEGQPQPALAALRRAWTGWRDLGVPYEAARTRVQIGRACAALGDQDGAAMERDAARIGFQLLGAAADVAQVEAQFAAARTVPGGLTGRELEVVVQLAKGKTNREIAANLVISEHTVARHVQNILAKLGLPSRTAVGSFAYEHGLV